MLKPIERAVAAEICMMPFGPDGLSAFASPQTAVVSGAKELY
jgi:hypothetical protein